MSTFNSQEWHDAELHEISIDRRAPGHSDTVSLRVTWPSGARSLVTFVGCYACTAEMHFGVIATETILTATELDAGPGLESVRARWSPLGVDLSRLRAYSIETASTGSRLTVYALGWELRPTP